jgi:DNA-binding CsgD family transcriptional regulator
LTQATLAARNRAEPTFYIVDGTWHVRFSCGRPPLRDGRRLPADLEETARYLASADLLDGSEPMGLYENWIIRLAELEGEQPLKCVLLERLRAGDPFEAAVARYRLTERESEVLRLLLRGAPTAVIAAQLNIAETTAAVHVKRIAQKTDARNRSQIIARVLGII